jgi:anthranilate synthase/aminodeoxychorismate synthase-like glutamine amidotransferase
VILLLDNYDSFVHNLARYFRRLGCQTVVIRSDQIDAVGCRRMAPEAIVISPGPRRPSEAGCSIEVIQQLGGEVPMLGVCLGHQAIAAAFGGRIVECGPVHGIASAITHRGSGLFANCRSPLQVGRYHSLAIDPTTLPAELMAIAYSDDGIIMAVQHRTLPIYGVQFHPESVLTDQGSQLIQNFAEISRSVYPLPTAHRLSGSRRPLLDCEAAG